MVQMIIQIEDKEKLKSRSELLTALNVVHSLDTTPQNRVPETQVESSDFFSMAGLWEGREVTLTSIRQKAWTRLGEGHFYASHFSFASDSGGCSSSGTR